MLRNRTRRLVQLTGVAILAFLFAAATPGCQAGDGHEPVVTELLSLIESRPDLQESLEAAIDIADLEDIRDMGEFAAYLDHLVTFVPTERLADLQPVLRSRGKVRPAADR